MVNASHKMLFTKPQSQHKHHQTHTWASPQISKNATGIIQHPFDTKARGTKLNYLNTVIWTLNDNNKPFTIKCRVLKQCKPYNSISNKCNLCLFEKYVIICKKNRCSLNKCNELASSCPHRTRYLLKNFVIK